MTAVHLQSRPTALSLAFGAPAEVRSEGQADLALFGPGQVVGYLARRPPAQALYIFRTAPANHVGVRLRHVSRPVDLFYVGQTRRCIRKATIALRAIEAGCGTACVDTLPDVFWLRLADFIERREWQIVRYVTGMLAERKFLSSAPRKAAESLRLPNPRGYQNLSRTVTSPGIP